MQGQNPLWKFRPQPQKAAERQEVGMESVEEAEEEQERQKEQAAPW